MNKTYTRPLVTEGPLLLTHDAIWKAVVGSKPLAGGLVIATINMLVVAGYCVPRDTDG